VATSVAVGLRLNNNYVLKSVLGEGGMGTVFLARHEVLGRPTAIKVLRPEMARDPTLVTRFFNEARAANAIGHPNIIEIVDVGMLPDECAPYMMMELLDGESLADRLRRLGRLSVPEAVEIVCQTAVALAAAHAHKIIHRDLKPGNLFLVSDLTRLPLLERVKVLDFGIAKLFDQSAVESVETRPGTLLGTPQYMSPEQCRGVSRDIDHRADIYALGIILYEMLCGAPPFVAEGQGDLIAMHIGSPPTPPRERNQDIPVALNAVILSALAKKPDERFQSMAEFESALRSAQGPATLAIAGQGEPARTTCLPPEILLSETHASTRPSTRLLRTSDTTLSNSAGQMVQAEAKKSWTPIAAIAAISLVLGAGAVILLQRTRAPTPPAVEQPVARVPAALPAPPDAAVVAAPPPPTAVPEPAPVPNARLEAVPDLAPVPKARTAASPAGHAAAKPPKIKVGKAAVPAPSPPASPKKSEAILDL
jgi:serine/threonine-protein kinase